MPQTSKSGWLAYSAAVAVTLAAGGFVVVVILLYRWRHPEAIHVLLSLCMLIVFFGGPLAAMFGSIAMKVARRRGQEIPSYARYAVHCAWCSAMCVVIYVLVAFVANGLK